MESLKRFALLYGGDVLAFVVGFLGIYIQEYFQSILGSVSCVIIIAGTFWFVGYITRNHDNTDGSERDQEILRELEERLPEIEGDLNLSEELREFCYRSMSMRERLEAWRRDPSLIQDRITILERLLQRTRETSSHATRGSTLSDMPTGQGSTSASYTEEDFVVIHNAEVGVLSDAGYMQQEEHQTQQEDEDEKRQKKFLEMLLQIPEALQVPENVIKEKSKGSLKIIFEELLKDISEEVLNEQFARKRLQEERDEEVLGEEAVEAVAEKETIKTIPAMDLVEGFLQQMVANKSLMQEIVKNVLEQTNKDVLGDEVAKEGKLLEAVKNMLATELDRKVTEDKSAPKMQVGEVPEEVMDVRYQTRNVLRQIFRNLLQNERERNELVKQKLPLKLQEDLEIEDGKIQNQQKENSEIISVENLQKNKEEGVNIEKVMKTEENFGEMLEDETTK